MKIDMVYTHVHRPFACFTCRKSFKRPRPEYRHHGPINRSHYTAFRQKTEQFQQEFKGHPCPQCRGPTSFMGVDFKPPKATDVKAWKEVEAYIRSGGIYRHDWYCAELPQVPGLGFHQGRDLVRAVRLAGFTVGDVPPMYLHQVPEFIGKLKRKPERLKRPPAKTSGRGWESS